MGSRWSGAACSERPPSRSSSAGCLRSGTQPIRREGESRPGRGERLCRVVAGEAGGGARRADVDVLETQAHEGSRLPEPGGGNAPSPFVVGLGGAVEVVVAKAVHADGEAQALASPTRRGHSRLESERPRGPHPARRAPSRCRQRRPRPRGSSPGRGESRPRPGRGACARSTGLDKCAGRRRCRCRPPGAGPPPVVTSADAPANRPACRARRSARCRRPSGRRKPRRREAREGGRGSTSRRVVSRSPKAQPRQARRVPAGSLAPKTAPARSRRSSRPTLRWTWASSPLRRISSPIQVLRAERVMV